MTSSIQTPIDSKLIVSKLKNTLDNISSRLSLSDNTNLTLALSELNSSFRLFFDTFNNPEFKPELLVNGDTARSEVYNNNLRTIYNDLNKFYNEISLLNTAQLKAFNFSSVLIKDVLAYSNFLASTVLDLNILNGFNRKDTLVVGDDFKTSEFIDDDVGLASPKAELITSGAGIGLSRDGKSSILDNAKIEVIPIGPSTANNGVVNTSPTPGNLERFYEGNYYSSIGSARPEGGSFNIQYIVSPTTDTQIQDTTNSPADEVKDTSFFVEIGASTEEKLQARLKMIDGNPGTFWECEYLFKTPNPIIENLSDSVVADSDGNIETSKDIIKTGSINIDLVEAERIAQQYDTIDIDLIVDIIITFSSVVNVNFVAINPVLFGSQSFPEVEDIATNSDSSSNFKTIDGWDRIRFSKTITPEANEYLTTSQLGATLSPSRSNYLGQGVFPFPVRQAKKLKIRMRVKTPVPAIYERTYVLLRKTTNLDTTVTTTTTRGFI